MKKIAISAETTIDVPKKILDEYDIHVIPFHVLLGERDAPDGEITPQDIFDYVDKTGLLPKTSAVNEFQYEEYFKELRKEYDAVIHVCLSSGISSSCENAIEASKRLDDVYVVDSHSLSTGIALLCIYARQLVKEGKEPEEIVKLMEKRREFLQVSFVVNTMKYLYKGGRCTGLQKFAGALFRIKPQIVLRDGKMIPGKRYHGRNTPVVRDYCLDTLEEFDNPDLSIVFVTHSHASEDMVIEAKKILRERGFKNIIETTAAATITSHCGPKTLGILYINDGGVK